MFKWVRIMFERFVRREKKLISEFIPNENLERLVAEYAEAVHELVRCKMDDPLNHLEAAEVEVARLEREHGDMLRAYLEPYKNFPHSYFSMPKEEYPRWYSAGALESRSRHKE